MNVKPAKGKKIERERAEEALRENEERCRRLIELSPDAMAVHSEGKIVFINTAGARLLGAKNPKQIIGKPIMDFLHPDYRKTVNKRFRKVRKKGRKVPFVEEKFIQLDGTKIDVEVAATSFTYLGKPAVLAVARDITEHKRAEDEIRQIKESYDRLTDNADEAIFRVEAEGGHVIYVNPAAERLIGYSLAEWLADPNLGFKIIHPDFAEKQKQIIEKINTSKKPIKNAVLGWIAKDGREVILEYTIIPITDEEGKIIYFESIGRDITERKRVEDENLKAVANKQRMEELEKFAKIAVGRELRMVELKKRIKELESNLEERS